MDSPADGFGKAILEAAALIRQTPTHELPAKCMRLYTWAREKRDPASRAFCKAVVRFEFAIAAFMEQWEPAASEEDQAATALAELLR